MKAKRLFALLLALVMLLTLLPTAGWATEETEDGSDPAITVTRELPEEPEAPETAELQPLLSEDEDIPIPGAERNVVEIDDDFVADLSGLQEDEDVCGDFEIVSEREPDGEPVPSARRRLVRSTYTFSGSGTKADPWLISSEEDLAGLAAMVNAGNSFSDQYFKLTDDITITAENWTPIGCAWDITFAGTFRGFEHTISGLTVTSEGDYVGLFGCVTGTINALYVSDAAISGNDYVGGIAGCNYGSIESCTFSGTVSGGDYVGGIAGCSGKDAVVANCDVNAEITSVGTGCGGVVGWANNIAGAGSHDESLNSPGADATGGGLVEECTFTGTLTGRSPYGLGVATSENGTITITVTANAFGGIVGWNNGCTVNYCNNYGTVNGDDFAGGIVGDSCNGGVVNGCENYGTVTGSSMLNGGIAGRIAEGSIDGCLNYGAVSGGDFTAGVVGAIDKYSSISGCFSMQESTVTSANGKYVGGVVGIANCYVYSCGNYGSVTGAYGVGGVVGWTTRDIYTCGNVGPVYCTSSEGRVGGVVGCSYGLVENCDNAGSIDGVTNVEGDVKAPVVGGVGGHLYGPMKNCTNTGSVSGGISVGGVAGGAQSTGLISGCTNEGAVSGISQTGGIIGIAYCLVTDCANLENGTVNGSGERIGGVIGCLDDVGRAEHIRNEGTVTGGQYVGGLIGMALCEVSGLTNDGSVNGGEYTGGIAGFCNVVSNCINHGAVKSTTNDKVGGIVGACNSSIASCTNTGAVEGKGSTGGIGGAVKGVVTDCQSSGSVTGRDEYAGGIIGYIGKGTEVSGCSNTAAVSGTQYVGGVVGYTYGEGGGISSCRNTAAVTGSGNYVGGVVGSTNGPVSNCENSAAVSSTEFVGGIAGLASDTAPIDHCTNASNAVVTGTGNQVGGIVGVGTGAVDTCVNEGAIMGKDYVGGIAGLIASDNGVVRSCSNKGTVSGTDCVGGLVGRVGQTADGTDPSGLVEASKNTGSVSGAASVGGAVGVLHGTVRDCENNGAVTGGEPGIGGIVGYCKQGGTVTGCKNLKAITAGWQQTAGVVGGNEGTVTDCVNEGAVEAGNNPFVGGIVGNNAASGTISGCTNKAKISGASNNSGGIAGASDGTINGCSNTGEISNTGGKIGGIVGNNNGTVSNCANAGQVKGKTSGNTYAGGIVGYSSGNISGCTNGAQINAGEGVGGIAGFFYGSSIDGCTNNGTVTAPAGVAGGIVGAINNNSSVLNCSNNGNVNASGKNDVGGIIGLAQKNNTVTNCANTASVTGNNCVGGILGENGSSGTYSKLTNSGTISGNFETGGIAGDATAVFSDCLNTGNVTGTGNSTEHGTGGICGRLVGGSAKAERCKNTGSVSGTYFVGGIVGMDNDASLYNCLNEGAISSRNTSAGVAHVGGCVGYIQNATVYKCVNYANVGSGTNINHVGGIAGTGAKMLFDFCRNYATITGRQEIGGIVGYTTHIDSSGTTIQRCINTGHVFASGADIGDVGGICGEADFHTTINECANNNPNAQVKADTGKYGGGIVGQLRNSTVSNCYNTGYVFAKGRQGGIVGEMKYTCTMATCFNKAGGDLIPVNGSTSPYRGALAGTYDKNATTLTYNYYSYYLGLPPMGNGTQAATASWNEHYDYYMWDNFGTQSNFKGFDFSNVYMMQSDRPRLRMEGGVATYSNTGPTTLADPVPETIRIYTVEDLANLRDNVNSGTDYSGTTIFLEADLNMNGVNWTPIGTDSHYFNGFFEGQGHTVYNLTVNTGNLCAGLFGVNVGTIQDLEVHGSVTTTNTSTGYAGGIVGANAGGTVNCCAFYGDVRCTTTGAQTFTGGIAGLMNTGTISNCFHVGDVEGAAASGGLVSYLLAGTLENCFHYSGRISGSSYSGGIAAICGGTVKNCYVLSGTTGSLFASGTGTNCAFKSAAEFKDTTLGLGNFWLCGGEHPELIYFSWMATLQPNGGTGSAAAYGVPFFRGTLPPCPFYRDGGYTFIGWNTKADGTGTWYDDCGSFATDETLYAQWLQGWKYYGYASPAAELFDNDIWSTYHCLAMERGETATVNFTTNDAVRPCAIAFYTADTPSPIPPSWRLEAKVHASDGDWTVLGESDGGSLSNTDKVVYVRLPNAGEDFYSAYRLVFQGPSDYVGLLEAWLLVSDPDADVRKPLILHSNDAADQTNVINANNGDTVSLGNPFTSDGNFFLGWNTAANGSGKSYANYEQITIDGVTDLYAQWLAGTHYRDYTALLVYDQFTELVNGLPANDSQYLGYSGEEYDKLLDDDVNTKWCGKVRSADAEWSLEFSTDDYVKPVGYVLVTGDDTAGSSGRNPKNWTLEGLSKEGTWVMLDGILQDKSLPAANHAEICRKVYNDQEYCRFRITFRGLGSGTTFQLSELYLVTNGDARQPTVTFDSHGGTGTTPSVSGKTESTVRLPENGFTREGYDFVSWNTAKDGSGDPYDSGELFRLSGDTTLYAQWAQRRYTVKFLDENGETLYETTTTSGMIPVYKGDAPTKEGNAEYSYAFAGWTPVIVPVDKNTEYTVVFKQVSNTYEEPTWVWSTSHDSATATFACINDPDRVEEVQTTNVTSKTTAATCEEDGKIEYFATVSFLGQNYEGKDTVVIPKTGHAYKFTKWEWTGTDSAKAIFTCGNDESHVKEIGATITSATTAPTCEGAGKTIYTAKVTFENKTYKDTVTVPIDPTGHAYKFTKWEWTGTEAAKAIFTCGNDATHVKEIEATITSEYTAPTCEGAGKTVYTAKVTFEDKTYTDSKTVTIDPTGHAYALTGWSWEGYTKATATFTCGNDASHVKTVGATITSVRTEPTCTVAGKIVYTATVTFEGKEYQDVKTVKLDPTGHSYGEPTWNWATDYKTAEAIFACLSGDDKQTVKATVVPLTVEPTCTLPGKITYTATVTFEGKTYEDHREVTIQPHGHSYGAPVWTWADDYTTAKATFTCTVDPAHVEEVEAKITSERTDPTCEGAGKIVYTAKVTFEGKEFKDVKAVTLDPIGHAYSLTGWTWTGYAKATATFTCGNDATHVKTVEATITSERTEPTADDDGKIVYTATVTFEEKTYKDTKTEILPALGRDYELTGWTWDGYTSAKANFTDKNGSGDISVDAKITSVRTEPTCEAAGKIVYTATVTLNEKTYTDTKTEVLDPIGHAYSLTGWTWDGYEKATATFSCDNDASHIATVDAKITSERTEPTCEGEGKTVYTATVTFEEKTYTDTKTETLDPLGHAYALTGWTWDGCEKATATFTCGNDASHIKTVEAKITSERTEPTCEGEGKIVYTATVTFEEKTYTDTKTETLKPIGHAYALTDWTWDGYEKATATFTCANDKTHVVEVEATITSERTEPTADENGKVVYTATVEFEEKTYTDEKIEILPALGRDYELTGWTWDGYTSAKANFTDKNGSGDISVDAKITSVRTEPACEEEGKVVYTAEVTLNGKTYTDSKTEALDPIGHAYALTEWTWDGYEKATATFTCGNDASHVVTVEAVITSERTEPTADTDGKIVYTATVEFEGETYKDEKTEILPALGREYEVSEWTWDGFTAATATLTDKNGSGTITVEATITSVRTEPTCEADGKAVYTATAAVGEQTFTDEKTEILPATGHKWGAPVYVWAEDDSAVTATLTCLNDASHKITETVKTEFVLTQYSTYKTEGRGVYTATFTNELFTTQTKEITIPAVACDGGDTCPGKHFTDEPTIDSWAHIPIDWAVVNKITFGTSPTTFSPDDPCTRAQFVTFLWRTMGQPEPTITDNPFKDVAEDTYYYKAVLWASENGITLGTSETTFSPDEDCNRAQIVTFLWRMEGKQEPASTETAFTDIQSGAWYYTAVLWAVEKEITVGTSETTFSPTDLCTRAQCLAFLYREFAK
ncbi:MAG: S-layer homology domain-containing protein [Oscillospiraceae bacterium]|nr:S-layer homology domain-containing protein [Oscillospiraceae bacterium]